jgi:hypothetical protein
MFHNESSCMKQLRLFGDYSDASASRTEKVTLMLSAFVCPQLVTMVVAGPETATLRSGGHCTDIIPSKSAETTG